MKQLSRVMAYYGSKWRLAKYYPGPRFDKIVEPFAGSAGYSLLYWNHEVILVEKDVVIASIWKYLIEATPEEIIALPLLQPGQSVDDLKISEIERQFIGMNLNLSNSPKKHLTTWAIKYDEKGSRFWSKRFREKVARTVKHIKHWKIIHGDYQEIDNLEATWFIDPPYQNMGRHYYESSDNIDFAQLSEWCLSRNGQIIVCENEGADWLQFEFLVKHVGNTKEQRCEMIYSGEHEDSLFDMINNREMNL